MWKLTKEQRTQVLRWKAAGVKFPEARVRMLTLFGKTISSPAYTQYSRTHAHTIETFRVESQREDAKRERDRQRKAAKRNGTAHRHCATCQCEHSV